MADKPDFAPNASDDEQYRHLRDYCSRLAGDRLCRCGASLGSRYCLWSYLRPAPVLSPKEKNS